MSILPFALADDFRALYRAASHAPINQTIHASLRAVHLTEVFATMRIVFSILEGYRFQIRKAQQR
jgi:hypothetical protein